MVEVFIQFSKNFLANPAADSAAPFLAFFTAFFYPAIFPASVLDLPRASQLKELFAEVSAESFAEVIAELFTEILAVPVCTTDFLADPAADFTTLFPAFTFSVGADSAKATAPASLIEYFAEFAAELVAEPGAELSTVHFVQASAQAVGVSEGRTAGFNGEPGAVCPASVFLK